MRNIFQKVKIFHVILVISVIFVSFTLYLSLPSLFDYKKLQLKIEKQIESDTKIKLANISDIKYRFFPSPHLIIKQCEMYFVNANGKKISDLKNIKIFISVGKLYDSRKIHIKKISITNANLNFNFESLNFFLNQLQSFYNKPIFIKKSKFFFANQKQEISLISSIYNFSLLYNEKSKQKKLKMKGNLFDTNFDFKWIKDFNRKNVSDFSLKFKKPNLTIENNLSTKDNLDKQGNMKINFLSNNLNIRYLYNDNKISFKTLKNKLDPFEVDGNIELDPFTFKIETVIKKQKINYIIKNILFHYFNYKNKIHPNINGDMEIKLDEINNAFLNSGKVKLNFSNSKILIDNNIFSIRDIGSMLIKNSLFYEENGKIFFVSQVEMDIYNQKQFYRRFSIPIKDRINLKKIYAVVEKDIDSDSYALSNISYNKDNDFYFNLENISLSDKIYFDNFQKFRNIIKDSFQTN